MANLISNKANLKELNPIKIMMEITKETAIKKEPI